MKPSYFAVVKEMSLRYCACTSPCATVKRDVGCMALVWMAPVYATKGGMAATAAPLSAIRGMAVGPTENASRGNATAILGGKVQDAM